MKKNLILPQGFVFLKDIDSSIIQSVRYRTSNNFTGRVVEGCYDEIICTYEAAVSLTNAQASLKQKNYELVVYDGYRPARVPLRWMEWSKDEEDIIAKPFYYPTISKEDMFALGYVSEKSSHSRGSTFEVSLIEFGKEISEIEYLNTTLTSGKEIPFLDDGTVNMGSSFDLFHEASWHDSNLINQDSRQLRDLLRTEMVGAGFVPYKSEWWHYTLQDEPFPDTYFDF
ncbi:MAG: M15 family metallopeptidase [Rickettsiaceae bacterium]|nr:M15 family metallopeptidase [Rickettsiaceae bacterium]